MKDAPKLVDTEALAVAFFDRRSGGNYMRPEKSIREVAKEIGLSYATLSRVECKAMPDLVTYIKLCRWLGVPMEKFLIG